MPLFEYAVTFLFFAEEVQVFARAYGCVVGGLDLVVDEFVLGPLCFFWALPEVDGVLATSVEECLYFARYWEDDSLEGVGLRFQNFPCRGYGVSNDGDGTSVFVVHGWDEAKAHGHKFRFNGRNIHCLKTELVYDRVVGPYMRYSGCNIGFLDVPVHNDGDTVREGLRLFEGLVELLDV